MIVVHWPNEILPIHSGGQLFNFPLKKWMVGRTQDVGTVRDVNDLSTSRGMNGHS